MAELLLGEAKLEQYLKEHPLRQGASPRGPRPQLTEVRKHLTAALDRGNLKSEFLQESSLVLAKLHYVEGDYDGALSLYARAGLEDWPLAGAPPYRLRMAAEAYATQGLCLEKLPISSSTSSLRVDREQDIITCYEKAGDIALLYLQEIERVILSNIQNRSPKPGPAPHDQELGFFLETGLQRAHVLYFKNGSLTRGVGRFRELLRAVETRTTQNLRMTIARQLAEILLRGMCEQSYWNPLEDPPCQSPLDDPLRKGANTKTYTLTRKARVYSGENIFCPQENTEEALLLLLISESMANRDAVLSRIPEHKSDRLISLQSASVVYDLLTIALGRRGQYEMLSECLERAMKFAFEEFHLWYQFALSLMAAGKSARAVKVLKECIRLKPDDAAIPLLAAKLCVGSLHWLEEAEKFAKTVVDAGEKTSEFKAKGYLALGLTYSLQATDASLRGVQEVLQRKALLAFQRAHSLSPTDHQAAFYLALQLAISRQIPEALGYVRQALQLQGDDANSLHLLALLLSAQKHYHDALNIIDMALSEYPENFILLFSKVKLESLSRGPDEALLTCKHMLQIWKSCYNLTNPSDSGRGSSLLDRTIADRRQLNTITLPDFSDPETEQIITSGKTANLFSSKSTCILLSSRGMTVYYMTSFSLQLMLHPRHISRGLQSGAGAVRSGFVPAEQRPQAGPLAPLDDAGADLAARSGSLHRHREARGGHGLHAGSCQPLPHVPQRPLHARPGGGAPRERGRGPAVVRGGLVHQPHPREEHAAAGPDPPPAGPLQSGREDPAGRGAGELHGPRGLERPGRGPAGSGQRRGGHRVLPDGPGAGGQQPRGALHRHPARALSRPALPFPSPPAPCPSRHPPRPALPVTPRALPFPSRPAPCPSRHAPCALSGPASRRSGTRLPAARGPGRVCDPPPWTQPAHPQSPPSTCISVAAPASPMIVLKPTDVVQMDYVPYFVS
ncbi:tetratricopeptide repeat protein 7B isoform X3 [Ovis aries]|nr:tetratricopeptide repeat protein 7B isoform X3 [Ovis aries]XP_042108799.1 tetratricopeptide repeat protein 7B isoform X3 [Ovis aries]